MGDRIVYLTDARRVGIMLRDKRLTLRNHAALTRIQLHGAEGSSHEYILQAIDLEDKNNYVRVADKNAFKADEKAEKAQHFRLEDTELGTELKLADGSRPAILDDFYDVGIGQWKNGYSRVPILVHGQSHLAAIWGKWD